MLHHLQCRDDEADDDGDCRHRLSIDRVVYRDYSELTRSAFITGSRGQTMFDIPTRDRFFTPRPRRANLLP